MHQVQLSEQLYRQAERRAAEAGYTSVDDFVTDVVSQSLSGDAEDFDHLFTPERLEHIDKAAADIEAGDFITSEQAKAEFARQRSEWLQKNAR